jgi:rubrerythrin
MFLVEQYINRKYMNKTVINLAKAFIGESQARNRYTYYSKIAIKEGYEQIAEIFLLTAEQEKIHAKRIFEHLAELNPGKEDLKAEMGVITGLGTTKENLEAAIKGENYENEVMYPEFAKAADEEGYAEIASRLRSIAIAEGNHSARYSKYLIQLNAGTLFKKSEKIWWVCRECGYIHYDEEAPKKCPSCDHPQSFYQVRD